MPMGIKHPIELLPGHVCLQQEYLIQDELAALLLASFQERVHIDVHVGLQTLEVLPRENSGDLHQGAHEVFNFVSGQCRLDIGVHQAP